jgi:hypothetical protein
MKETWKDWCWVLGAIVFALYGGPWGTYICTFMIGAWCGYKLGKFEVAPASSSAKD